MTTKKPRRNQARTADARARKRDATERKRQRDIERQRTRAELARTRKKLADLAARERAALAKRQKERAAAERKALKAAQTRRTKANLAKLKAKNLYRGDARKPPTRYGKSLVEKMRDVLSGKAAVIQAPTKEIARRYKEAGFKVKGGKIVVPKEAGEKVRISKTGEISSKRKTLTGKSVRKIIEPRKRETVLDLPTHSKSGKPYQYAVPFNRGGSIERFRFPDRESLAIFMSPGYDKRYPNWLHYVELEVVDKNGKTGDEENEDF